MSDKINHPEHYNYSEYEPIDVINAWGLSFNLGNVVKYIARAGRKGEETILDDLRKARFYLNDYIKRLERDSELPQSETGRIGRYYDNAEIDDGK